MLRQLKFHRLFGRNFMCFGPKGIEILFDQFGNIILVKGINYDTGGGVYPEDSSNATGKSSLQDLVCYCLYGKTVKKKLNHGTVINAHADGHLEATVEFDDYKVQRCREPNSLRVWRSKDHIWNEDTEVTRGTMADTQRYIEGIIGLSYGAFCCVSVFDDSGIHVFLEADAEGKREVIDNLFYLSKYRNYLQNAKDKLKETKGQIKQLTDDYEKIRNDIDACDQRIKNVESQEINWRSGKQNEILKLGAAIKEKQTLLTAAQSGLQEKQAAELAKYNVAQEEIQQLAPELEKSREVREKVASLIRQAETKLSEAKSDRVSIATAVQQHQGNIQRYRADLKKSSELMASLQALQPGTECPVCYSKIDKSNFAHVMTHELETVKKFEGLIADEEGLKQIQDVKLQKKDEQISSLDENLKKAKPRLVSLDAKMTQDMKRLKELGEIKRPVETANSMVLEAQIVELKKQVAEKQKELETASPYTEIIQQTIDDKKNKESACQEKSQELKQAESMISYYEFWVTGFGDEGIRKMVINDILPALNTRIAYWLQYLYDTKMTLEFSDTLEETITRNGTPVSYNGMSAGEKRRTNLAVSQGLSYVMTLNSGSCPSLLFLDEVTGGSIDRAGVTCIYNTIFEIAKERQILLTTHNATLLEMLSGCESLVLTKKDDISTLAS